MPRGTLYQSPLGDANHYVSNRLVRIRMLGGVGGSRSNAGPIPIPLFVDHSIRP
jgi:hypothetical protein